MPLGIPDAPPVESHDDWGVVISRTTVFARTANAQKMVLAVACDETCRVMLRLPWLCENHAKYVLATSPAGEVILLTEVQFGRTDLATCTALAPLPADAIDMFKAGGEMNLALARLDGRIDHLRFSLKGAWPALFSAYSRSIAGGREPGEAALRKVADSLKSVAPPLPTK